jgi:hypothetical protein
VEGQANSIEKSTRVSSNTISVIVGIPIVLAIVVLVQSRIRRSTPHSLSRLRRTRDAANDALRNRLEAKAGTEVEFAKAHLGRVK